MPNQDQDMPNRTSNMEKAEGDRKSEWGEGTSEGAGASNRPMGGEVDIEESERVEITPGTNQG